jgi:signal-transduction protein with cAMP-binding, CBS, and nucleotidyltransferase domain
VQRKIIPGVIDGQQALWCLPPDATACDAARLMRERRIGGVMVAERGALVGIVTERDMVTRLIADGRDPKTTRLGEIMTANPETLRPDDTALSALEKMQAGRYRHLPVLDADGRVCGMVSIRDLFEAVRRSLEEELHSAEALIYGDNYGTAAPSPH